MKSIRLWARESERLSALERAFFREALESLLSWEPFREEYGELDLVMRTLALHSEGNRMPAGLDEACGRKAAPKLHELSMSRYGIPPEDPGGTPETAFGSAPAAQETPSGQVAEQPQGHPGSE